MFKGEIPYTSKLWGCRVWIDQMWDPSPMTDKVADVWFYNYDGDEYLKEIYGRCNVSARPPR